MKFHFNDDSNVLIQIFFIDERIIPQKEVLKLYRDFRENAEFIAKIENEEKLPFNKVYIFKHCDKYWYASIARDKGGKKIEELFFFEQNNEIEAISSLENATKRTGVKPEFSELVS